MCGRYTLKSSTPELEKHFQAASRQAQGYEPNYNVAPTHRMPVVRQHEGQRIIERQRWGLLPFWAKEQKVSYSMINARSESLATKRSFRRYFKSQRCLIPASGFYEWKGAKGNKTPFYIYPTQAPVFAFAGLYSLWESPEGEQVPSYTIVTTRSNDKMNELHDRMPVMLIREEWDWWLDPDRQDTAALQNLFDPFPDDAIDYYQVSQRVGNVRNNDPALIEKENTLFN